ncbi:MAG: hypothetical protein GC168_21355 [Candidatus Hydrogenedens sp.]|nr:hypothetical protein [Candidatus Hydrogenedens sp.]
MERSAAAQRALSFLERQHDWLAAYQDEMQQLLGTLETLDELEPMLLRVRRMADDMNALIREQGGMAAEWRSESRDPAEDAQVQAAATRVEAMALACGTLADALAAEVVVCLTRVREEERALGRGRGMLKGYQPLDSDPHDHVDRRG